MILLCLGLLSNSQAQEDTAPTMNMGNMGNIVGMVEVTTTRELTVAEHAYNTAATAMNDGRPKDCMHTLSTIDSTDMYTEQFLSLGYICAIAASHLKAADLLRTELGLEYLPPSSLDIHHAWMLRHQKKSKKALEVLTPEGWTTQRHKELGTTMQAVLYADLNRWTEAWLLAASPYVEQNAQLYIAQQLRMNGHVSKAKSLYDAVCPSVQDAQKMGCASILSIPNP